MLLPALLMAGQGLAAILPGRFARVAAPGIALALAGMLFFLHGDAFYQLRSHPGPGGFYKEQAESLAPILREGDVLVGDQGHLNALDWYLSLQMGKSPLRWISLSPESREARLVILEREDVYALDENVLGGDAGLISSRERLKFADGLFPTIATLRREPGWTMRSLPFETSPLSSISELLHSVNSMKGVSLAEIGGRLALTAAENNAPGEVEFLVRNEADVFPQEIVCGLLFVNSGQGNVLTVEHSFDGEPFTADFSVLGPSRERFRSLRIKRDAPFRTLAIRVRLLCTDKTPDYPGDNLKTLSVTDFAASVCAPGQTACSEMLASLAAEGERRSYLAQRFSSSRDTVKEALLIRGDNAREEKTEYPGWSVYTPLDDRSPALLRVLLDNSEDLVHFFPRVSGAGSSVELYILTPDNRRTELLSITGKERSWTPISAQYAVDFSTLPPGKIVVEIVMRGRWSQIWNRKGAIFFH